MTPDMPMIDSHAHLDASQYDQDRPQVIERAFKNGLKYIINIGSDLETSQASAALASQHKKIYATVGIHPMAEQETGCDAIKDMAGLEGLVREDRVVAIGECGLELNQKLKVVSDAEPSNIKNLSSAQAEGQNDKSKIKKQTEIFLTQIKLAQGLNLPLIIHCRNAHNEMLEILSGVKNLKAVIHCYSGSWDQARKYLDLGCCISFTGIITYARDYDKVIKNMPIERMLLETDCPYLTPVPNRGQRNEPLSVKYVYETIARVRGELLEKTEEQIDKNVIKFFDLES